MADNVIANPGAGGAEFATDQDPLSSAHYPINKIVWGPSNVFNLVNDSDGNAFPVQIWNDSNQAAGMPANPWYVAGQGTFDTELPVAVTLADAASNPTTPLVGAALLVWNGASWDRLRASNVRKDLSAVAIGSIATVWTPASGKKFRLMGGCISVSAAANVLFEDNSAGAGNFICRTPKLLADTPYNFDLGNGYLSAAANNVLKATSSASANVTGFLYGTEE